MLCRTLAIGGGGARNLSALAARIRPRKTFSALFPAPLPPSQPPLAPHHRRSFTSLRATAGDGRASLGRAALGASRALSGEAQSSPKTSSASSQPRSAAHAAAPPPADESAEDKSAAGDAGAAAAANGGDAAAGGFFRGLFGGREAAAEDEFRAEARRQGVHVPPPNDSRQLQVVRRRRQEEEDEGEEEEKQHDDGSIRSRLYARFRGSAFMKNAFEARDRLSERIDESDNPMVNFFRGVYDRLFAENEMGQVLREIRRREPDFRISDFLRHVDKELVPRVLQAYLSTDLVALRKECTSDAFEVLEASFKERQREGVVMDPTILSIDDVDLAAAQFLEDNPVLIVSFSAQQINCLRDRQGTVVEGKPDDIRAVYYVWALTREPDSDDEEEQKPTGGSERASSSSAAGSNGGGENSTAEAAGSAGDEADKDKKKQLPPWKLMEMVIRGAHSTI